MHALRGHLLGSVPGCRGPEYGVGRGHVGGAPVAGANAAVEDGGIAPNDGDGVVQSELIERCGASVGEVRWLRCPGDDVCDQRSKTERPEQKPLREGDMLRLVEQGQHFGQVPSHCDCWRCAVAVELAGSKPRKEVAAGGPSCYSQPSP